MKEVWTIIEIVKWTSHYFEKQHIESPRLKTELLLCHLLDISRVEIYSNYDKPLSENELTTFKTYIKRVLKHEPVQMIIGKVDFLGLEIRVDSRSIVPRPETEELVQLILSDKCSRKALKILDIGTGTGCIALRIAKEFPDSEITAIDVSSDALELARGNAAVNRIQNVTFQQLDVSNERIEGKFDIIVSNPPYIDMNEYQKLEPEVREFEPMEALTDRRDGLAFYRIFAEMFKENLQKDGIFYLEFGWGQQEQIREIFSADFFEIAIRNDMNNIPRIVKGKLI